MINIDWESIVLEYYYIAALSLLCLILIISLILSRRRIRQFKQKNIADQIDLQESGKREKWFSVFTKTIPQVFWIRGETMTHFVSPHFEELTGHSEKLIHDFPDGLLKICYPDDYEVIKQAHINFHKNELQTLDVSFRIKKSGNHYIWIRERIFRHRHFSGEKFVVGLLEDVTEKQLSIEEINDNRLLLDNILDSTDEGIFCLDKDFRIIYWNQEMQAICGMSAGEVINRGSIFNILPHLSENGAEEIIRLAARGQISESKTFPYHLPNNRKGFTEEKYLPLSNSRGEIIGVIGIIKDVSEELARDTILEKTQERYGLTLKAVNDGIWDWNMISDELIFSDRWFTMLGYEADELSSSKSTLKKLLATPLDIEVFENGMEDLYKGQSIEVEVKMTSKSNEIVWVLIRGKCIEYDSNGRPTRAIGTQTDITRRKTNELDLIAARDKAEESDKLKSAFLANMSHEIRTPLNAIVGFTDLITGEDPPSEEEKDLCRNQIRKNSENLLKLIDDIILLSTMESGQYVLNKSSFDLVELMTQTAKRVYKQFGKLKADKVTLKLQFPPEVCELSIVSDRNLVEIAIFHLLRNGLSYTNEGRVILGFKFIDDNTIEIFCKDTGIGIDPVNLDRIFKQFEQLDKGLSRTHEGTGLGLSLTRKITILLNGKIRIESEPNKGSCFCFTLPYQTP
jgi:PAS domain S-box-containing protein